MKKVHLAIKGDANVEIHDNAQDDAWIWDDVDGRYFFLGFAVDHKHTYLPRNWEFV